MALITDAVPCVRIVPRTNQRDYVTIRSDDPGCSAHFGNMGGVHIMNLDRGCVVRAHIEHNNNARRHGRGGRGGGDAVKKGLK